MPDAYLEVWRDGEAERVRLLGTRVTLGRAPGNDVSFPSDDAVSRQHAVLQRGSKGWSLQDVGSSNGTYVNGQKIVGEHVLELNDEITLGGMRVLFQAGEPFPVADGTFDQKPLSPLPAASSAESHPAVGKGPGYLDLSEEWRADPDDGGTEASHGEHPLAPTLGSSSEPPPATPEDAPQRTKIASVDPLATRPNRGSGRVRGLARSIQVRRPDANQQEVLAFRVDRYDSVGNRLAPVPVELWGYQRGQVTDGEEIEVTGRWSHGTLKAKRIENLSTNAEVAGFSPGVKVFYACVIVAFICFFAFILYSIVTAPEVSNPFE